MSEKKIIRLKYPIPIPMKQQDGSEKIVTINSLELERLKIKHLKKLPVEVFEEGRESMSPMMLIPFLSGVFNIPESSIDEIDLEDLEEIGNEVMSFLPQFQEIGRKQS